MEKSNGSLPAMQDEEKHMNPLGTAFASDYDGTLCISNWATGEERFDPAVLAAVRRYQEAGGLFGICTGRALFSIEQGLADKVDLDFYIVMTGAQVLDKNKRVLFERVLDRDVTKQIYDRYVVDDTVFLAITDSEYVSVGAPNGLTARSVQSIDEVEERILGLSLEFHGDYDAARVVLEDLNSRFGNVVVGFQNLDSVDVVPCGCSKGSGVDVVREALGVDCVVGAGDSFNDLALLAAADVSYTFHSSPQQVRDAATYVVTDLAEALADFT